MDNNKLIYRIISRREDFDSLPRDKDGYCVYSGDLDLSNKNLTHLPDNLKVTGDFNCRVNQLTKLPDNLYVGGECTCTYNPFTELPKGLYVVGDLDCRFNQMSAMPDDFFVGGNINLHWNTITKRIKGVIGGRIYMDKIQHIKYRASVNSQKTNISE